MHGPDAGFFPRSERIRNGKRLFRPEIKDGAFTGKVVSPVVMTGYVPDLLGNISMASPDWELEGTGACGKGHKEWVKVAEGGPYLKTKARLG